MPLSALGTLTGLDTLSTELIRRIGGRGLGPPRAFQKIAEQILIDHPECQALVLPAGTIIEGDVQLDYEALLDERIGTVAALGDLEIRGRLINESCDGGPFLFVDGELRAGQIEKGGASFVVLGSVISTGLIFCDYNHGTLLVGGNLSAPAIICNEQDFGVAGRVTGRVIDPEANDIRDRLVAEVFEDPDDPADTFIDAERLRERLAGGLPVLRCTQTISD